MLEIVPFDQWVHENNPNPKLTYGKGWWDFIGVLRALAEKLEIHDVSVVATFVLHTPPPAEELTMPVVRLVSPHCRVFLKEDFGQFNAPWTISVERLTSRPISHLDLFLAKDSLTPRCLRGLEPDRVFPPYSQSAASFSARVADAYDVYAVLRLLTSANAVRALASSESTPTRAWRLTRENSSL